MADNTVKFIINVDGNAITGIAQIDSAMGSLLVNAKKTTSFFENFTNIAFKFNVITDAVRNFSNMLSSATQPGIDFEYSLADLSALTGVVGEGLDAIGKSARENAKIFGGDASKGLASYKVFLGQLSPELAKTPEALAAMGRSAAILSKQMGNDAVAAAETLNTAMNQYQVSLADPIKASEEMAKMMNIMTEASRKGSAELPLQKAALEQVGMSAKAASVSFSETIAAIQVLDKAGKRGSEGGVALRNIIGDLERGRFLPKIVKQEFQKMNVDVDVLGDHTLSLTDRLRGLKPIMHDAALMSKLFGESSYAAGVALLSGIDGIDGFNEAIKDTNASEEYATTVMDTHKERLSRINAAFEDVKISLFNVTGDFGIWAQVVATSLVPLSQLLPLLVGIGKMFAWIKGLEVWQSIKLINLYLVEGELAAATFGAKMLQAAISLVRFSTVGIFNAVKGVGALILSLITGGATSTMFAGVASTAFGVFATSAKVACTAVTTAISSIPIIGWVAIGITALGVFFAWLYKKFDGFRAFINGIGAALKAVFTGNWGNIGKSFTEAYDKTLQEAKKAHEKADKESPEAQIAALEEELKKQLEGEEKTELNLNKNLNNTAVTAAGDNKIKNINITIDKVIDKFTVSTTTLKESTARIKELVAQAIIEGCNDVNLAF